MNLPQVEHPSGRFGRRELLLCLLLFFGTLSLFSRAVPHDFLDYDDPDYVTQNPHVRAGLTGSSIRWAFTSTEAGNWHPLTWLSHELDWQLFGNDPRGHHATSVLFHALNAVLAFLVLRRLTGAVWLSAVCAALFAWHPLRVESVAWISERKDVLSVFFGLLALDFYARYVQVTPKRPGRYLLTLLFFALGLMCKPMLVTLPFLLLLLDFWPLRRANDSRLWLIIEKIPFILLSLGSCIITYFAQRNGGAVVGTFSLAARFENAVVSVAAYLGNFVWPFNLAVGYPLPPRWPVVTIVGATMLLVAVSAIALWQWRSRPWLLVGWLWFLGALIPVIGIVQVGIQARADRYTYLPMLGVQLALLWTLREIILSKHLQRIVPLLLVLLLGACATRTWNQLAVWKNPETLYQHALAVDQNNYLAHCYLGSTYFNTGRLLEAEPQFRAALALKPDYAAARHRLGLTLEKLGRPDEAFTEYTNLLALRPDSVEGHYSLGALLLDHGRPGDAMEQFQAVLDLKPDNAAALIESGLAATQSGDPQSAVTFYERALALQPDSADAHFDLGNVLIMLHREPDALAHYEKALSLDPDFEKARANYANLLRHLGRPADACVEYRRALALDTNDVHAYYGLGAALEDLGNAREAMACYNAALRLDADYPGLHERLARVQNEVQDTH